ncbi:hypothetical protein T439DRAFT_233859 [Meredithblackwellia eburnea MCA 4105]
MKSRRSLMEQLSLFLPCGDEEMLMCPQVGGRRKCVYGRRDLESCGCEATDCSLLPNVNSVRCEEGECVICTWDSFVPSKKKS